MVSHRAVNVLRDSSGVRCCRNTWSKEQHTGISSQEHLEQGTTYRD